MRQQWASGFESLPWMRSNGNPTRKREIAWRDYFLVSYFDVTLFCRMDILILSVFSRFAKCASPVGYAKTVGVFNRAKLRSSSQSLHTANSLIEPGNPNWAYIERILCSTEICCSHGIAITTEAGTIAAWLNISRLSMTVPTVALSAEANA